MDLYKEFEAEIEEYENTTKQKFNGDFESLAGWFDVEGSKDASVENVRNSNWFQPMEYMGHLHSKHSIY